jgi:hypothetical protein
MTPQKKVMEGKKRFSGLRKDGVIIESDDINDFQLQDLVWFQESGVITMADFKKLYGKLHSLPTKPIKKKK